MNLALWIAAGLLAVVALSGGISKTFVPKEKVEAGGAALRYGGLYGPGIIDDQVELIRRRLFSSGSELGWPPGGLGTRAARPRPPVQDPELPAPLRVVL